MIVHTQDGAPFESMIVAEEAGGERPGILLFPNVLGTKEADFAYAERVAALGHAVLVADVFGQGKRTSRSDPDMGRYMGELNADRAMMRDRVHAAHATLKALPQVDAGQTAAIGFCFGGKCVLDLARSGADIAGGVSFHGVYDRPDYANVSPITAKLLVCHGWEDPLCPPDTMVALGRELTEGGADWQIHAYGNAGHAFTDVGMPQTPDKTFGHEERADRRSWKAMGDFLAELFV